jgi:hypothetical protein
MSSTSRVRCSTIRAQSMTRMMWAFLNRRQTVRDHERGRLRERRGRGSPQRPAAPSTSTPLMGSHSTGARLGITMRYVSVICMGITPSVLSETASTAIPEQRPSPTALVCSRQSVDGDRCRESDGSEIAEVDLIWTSRTAEVDLKLRLVQDFSAVLAVCEEVFVLSC